MQRETIEADVEAYFVARVEALGGVAEKTKAIGSRGYFDRVAVIPGIFADDGEQLKPREERWRAIEPARVIFAELKRPKGGVLAIHQSKRRDRYAALGAEAVVLKCKADIDALLGVAG